MVITETISVQGVHAYDWLDAVMCMTANSPAEGAGEQVIETVFFGRSFGRPV